jgi:hypothetical protein
MRSTRETSHPSSAEMDMRTERNSLADATVVLPVLFLLLAGLTHAFVREMRAETPRGPGIWNVREPARFIAQMILPRPWTLESERAPEDSEAASVGVESSWNANRSGDWLTALFLTVVGTWSACVASDVVAAVLRTF